MHVRFLCFSALLVAVTGCELLKSPSEPSDPPPPPNVVNYTAIGASDAIGFGSSSACLPFTPCPEGKGYVQLLEKRLKADGKTVTLLNLGLPGGVLGAEIQAIGNQLGPRHPDELPRQRSPVCRHRRHARDGVCRRQRREHGGRRGRGRIWRSGRARLRDGAGRRVRPGPEENDGRHQGARAACAHRRAEPAESRGIAIRRRDTRQPRRRALQNIAVRFSAEINKLTSQGATVVDIMCDGGFYQVSRYSSDGFHPNDAGYARMADVDVSACHEWRWSAPAGGLFVHEAVLKRCHCGSAICDCGLH